MSSRLDKQLGPEYISTRPGAGGGKVHYLAAEKVINLANEVFGFNGWSSGIQNVQVDFVDENPTNGKITLGLSTIVRVTLRDGTFHEDIGYGHIENCKGKAAAFEKAKKEAATDAMKRALRNFGNVLGNCLYDKDYLQKVTKLKIVPSRWDEEGLHRHPDYAPIKREAIEGMPSKSAPHERNAAVRRVSSVQSGASYGSAEFEDDFGGNLFEGDDFTNPDEVRLDDTSVNGHDSPAPRAGASSGVERKGVPRMHSMPHLRPPNVQAPQPPQSLQLPQRPQGVAKPASNAVQAQPSRMLPPQTPGNQQRQQVQQQPNGLAAQNQIDGDGTKSNTSSGSSTIPDVTPHAVQQPQPQLNGQQHGQQLPAQSEGYQPPHPQEPPPDVPQGFVTGRSAAMLNQPSHDRPPAETLAFNPHAESPSIRRTHGVNPGKSAPISRAQLTQANGNTNGQAPEQPQMTMPRLPAANGANSAPRPAQTNFVNPSADPNRRIGMPPPTANGLQNRGAYRPPSAIKRPALQDVSNLQMQTDGANDAKKAKIEPVALAAVKDGQTENSGAVAT